ncbi:MAG: 3-hydroxy-5-methyl-1-naphthoate 3-O-methyltransferase [bacterium]|nr:3-hydroxy-5-methyl-1-naphthoate 3-O-methyltransferase [bacterium]
MAQPPTTSNRTSIIKDQIQVLTIAEGFYQSSVLFALLKLEIFERLGDDSKTVQALAAEIKARPESLVRLLNAGVVLKLLETEDGTSFRAAPACRSVLLPSAGDNYLGNWIRLQKEFCTAIFRLDEAVLSSEPTADQADYLGVDPNLTRTYTLAMHNYASLRGKELAHYLDTRGCKTLLDLGCGSGTYAFMLGMRNPDLQLYLMDNAGVLDVAKEIQAKYPLQNEVHYLPFDAVRDDIPGSYDLILASNLLHIFDEATRRRLLARLHEALNPGGSVVIQSQHLQENRLGGRWAVFIDLDLLCTTKHGKNHTMSDSKRWLAEAGFSNIVSSAMSVYGVNSFVRGYKAA